MPATAAGHDIFADAKAAQVGEISLHTAAPADAGNEVTGGGYARQTPVYAAAANGAASLDGPLAFTGPADEPVAAVGYWTAGGTLLGYDDTVEGDAAFNAEGQYTVTQAAVTDE